MIYYDPSEAREGTRQKKSRERIYGHFLKEVFIRDPLSKVDGKAKGARKSKCQSSNVK